MKITHITTSNFLGARAVDIELRKPVALIAGKNGAGKSSVQEAVRMALTGEPVRVSLKKDYVALLTEGADAGFAEVRFDDDSICSIVLPSGKGAHAEAAAIPYVLDAQRFARMDDNARRAFLFGLMGVKMDGPAIKQRMVDRGCDAAKVEQVMPILRAGFDAAQKEAASRARDAKASWKTATGGETWGKDKAAKWQPEALPADAEKASARYENAVAKRTEVDAELSAAQQELGAAKAERRRQNEAEAKRMDLHEQASKIERIKTKLTVDTDELAAWEQRVADCRARAGAVPDPKSPGEYLLRGLAAVTDEFVTIANDKFFGKFDEVLLNRAATHLAEYKKLHGWPHSSKEQTATESASKAEAAAKLPEYENALALQQRAVANDKRDLAAAEQAAATLKELDGLKANADTGAAEAKVAELTEKRNSWQADAEKYRAIADRAARRQATIMKAAILNADVMAWTDIADALAPDGIPAELLAEALDPINEHLRVSASDAEWEPAQITADMSITYGLRPYALISESEKWRADALIAEAVSHVSGLKLLVLDRFDVLDLKGREDLLYWLDGMAADGVIDTAIIFGTLKALPALNFDNIGAFWIENGAAGQLKEAA